MPRHSESYLKQKLHEAVQSLVGSADIRTRVINAATGSLLLIDDEAFTDANARQEFKELRARLSSDKSDPETGNIATTCARLDETELAEIARKIVHLLITEMGGL